MPTVDDYYRNRYQYGLEDYTTAGPEGDTQAVSYATGYIPELLALRQRVRSGQASDWDREWYQRQADAAMAIPLREVSTLSYNAGEDAPDRVSGGSPDLGNLMLTLQDRIDQGAATPQERDLFQTTYAALVDQNWRASVPQASDANPFGMGDQFMQALSMLMLASGAGAGVGAAGAAGAGAAGAGAGAAASAAPALLGVPLSTLSTIGQIGAYGGMGANVLGGATQQPWLQQLGLGLGVTGGLAGGLAGLGNVLNTGVNSLTDAARLASSAGRIAGAGGRASGYGPLQQAAGYLGRAGQLGSFGASALPSSFTDWSGTNAPLAANVNPGVPGLLSAADMATQRGGDMSEWDYSWDYGGEQPYDNWSYAGGSPTFDESGGGNYFNSPAYQQFTGWGGDERQTGWYQNADLDTSGDGGWLNTVLGGLGAAGSFLGRNASWLGPAASALGGLGAGAVGANASRDASAAQTNALNRGIDLQTAQWLQQQQHLAPYLQAGQGGVAQLMQLAGRQQPATPGATPAVGRGMYEMDMPNATPGWNPQDYYGPEAVQAGAYRWTPGQGPSAAAYRYTPGQIPGAADYRYTPGAVPTLQGKELLANDPGYQFRQDEARRALEASALARGSGMSGATLAALQRQSSDLASQEYGNAWQRASQQAQMREGWAQTASQMGFGQAMSEAQMREQVNQVASQQGWSQAQAEAVFREQMAQQASQQGFNQALGAQGQQFTQGLQQAQWNQGQQQQFAQERYKNMLEQTRMRYGMDVTQNQTDYDRGQAAYRQQLAQYLLPWEQASTLANLGGQATGMYGQQGQGATNAISNLLGQLGTAQGMGTLGQAGQWNQAIASGVGGLQNLLRGLNT